jgi:hypothetical protein
LDIPLSEIISAGGAIAATSLGFTKILFGRLEKVENKFGMSIDKLSLSLVEIDKRLAVNSCIIEKFMEGCKHGNR